MSYSKPILVTGAAGQVGGIGGRIVELLRAADMPVRALVRRDDNRAAHLRQIGADVVIADLVQPEQVVSALHGCRRVYFGMGVSPSYLEATLVTAAAAREIPGFELLVNMSQVTVSELDLKHMTDSPQQRFLTEEYSAALRCPVRYEDVPLDVWRDGELRPRGLPEHVYAHILTMAKLHAAGRYDRLTHSVESILGRPAARLRTTLKDEGDRFMKKRQDRDK